MMVADLKGEFMATARLVELKIERLRHEQNKVLYLNLRTGRFLRNPRYGLLFQEYSELLLDGKVLRSASEQAQIFWKEVKERLSATLDAGSIFRPSYSLEA